MSVCFLSSLMNSVALYLATNCLTRSIDAIDSALLVWRDGTMFLSKQFQQRLSCGGG